MAFPDSWGVQKICRLSKYVEILYENVTNLKAPVYVNRSAKNGWALIWIHIAGDVTITTPQGAVQPEPLDIVSVDTNEIHSIQWGHKKPCAHYRISFDEDLFDDLLGNSQIQHDLVMDFLDHDRRSNLMRLPEPMRDELVDILNSVDALLAQDQANSAKIGMLSQIVRLFDLIYKVPSETKQIYSPVKHYSRLIRDAIDYTGAHFRTIPSLRTTAEHLHVSPGYLSRRFLSEVGTSYNTYLTDQKLAFARKRLQLGFTVAEASEEAGFTSPSYFIQLYKKKYGQTPAKSLK
jgi:AraC-like DNA-binding protein